MNNQPVSWTFYKIWNESLESRVEKEMKARNRMWASELGGAYVDRYLKMKGTPPTNPPNARSLRKFEAGNMMEWIVKMVLRRAGILLAEQTWLSFQYSGLLEVTGKLDFLAGGKPDWEKAKREIELLELPEFFGRATRKIIEYLSTTYPEGLKTIVLEIKSCSGFMFEKYESSGANKQHTLQAYHYLKCKNLHEAHIVYISKDDLRMLELPVFNPSLVEEEYKKDIVTMTNFLKSDELPPIEKEVVFSDNRFSANWKIAYSNYLTKLYGYKDQKEFDDKIKGKVAQWNRTLGRCVTGKKMTELNLKVIEEIKVEFPNFDEIVNRLKEKVDFLKFWQGVDTEEFEEKEVV